MIPIICTLLMIVIVIAGVVKKFHPVTVFFAVSLVSLAIWSLVTGQSAVGDATTGNIFLDIFEYAYSIIQTQISGTMLICASIFGYVGFMNKIGASQAFTAILARPLSKIKQPYVLLGILIAVESFLKLVIPSAASLTALLFAILYPIFAQLGCSGASIASAFVLGTCITWGPADAGVIGKIGGMTLLVEVLNGLGGGVVVLSVLGVLVGIVVVACTGSYTANLNIFVPFLVSVANVTGANPLALAQLGNMACGLGSGLTPVSATMLFLTGECKVDFPIVLKRNILPILAAAVTGIIVTMLLHVL